VKDRPDVAVLAFGTPAIDACAVADDLKLDLRVAVYDARFAKPVDADLIRALLEQGTPIVTIEDHGRIGGFGSAVIEAAHSMRLDASSVTVLGLPDSWIYQDSRAKQMAEAGIDRTGIRAAIIGAAGVSPAREASSTSSVTRDRATL
jgi:1-deoxy-D-xylulose-5-phosphate synthase